MKKKTYRPFPTGGSLLLAAFMAGAGNAVAQSTYNWVPGPLFNQVDHNFSWTAGAGKQYAIWTNPSGVANLKYLSVEIFNLSSVGRCYEVLGRINTHQDMDLKYWYQRNGVWTFLSDDSDGLMPRARIWLPANKGLTLRASAYSSAHNAKDFVQVTAEIDLSSAQTRTRANTPAGSIPRAEPAAVPL